MREVLQGESGDLAFSNTPILQYSNTLNSLYVPTKPLRFDLCQGFLMIEYMYSPQNRTERQADLLGTLLEENQVTTRVYKSYNSFT
jgi:hypothetical protein